MTSDEDLNDDDTIPGRTACAGEAHLGHLLNHNNDKEYAGNKDGDVLKKKIDDGDEAVVLTMPRIVRNCTCFISVTLIVSRAPFPLRAALDCSGNNAAF